MAECSTIGVTCVHTGHELHTSFL